jgi:hypothetical protein
MIKRNADETRRQFDDTHRPLLGFKSGPSGRRTSNDNMTSPPPTPLTQRLASFRFCFLLPLSSQVLTCRGMLTELETNCFVVGKIQAVNVQGRVYLTWPACRSTARSTGSMNYPAK